MNAHYKKAVDEIHKRNSNVVIKYLLDETFIAKYFPESEFNDEILSDIDKNEFNQRLEVALDEANDALILRRNVMFFLAPIAYFFGGIIRDFIIEYQISSRNWYDGDFEIYTIWFLWLSLFLVPLGGAIDSIGAIKSIKDYIRTVIKIDIHKNKQGNDKVINKNGQNYSSRLMELDKLLEEGLISQSEYDQKRKSILRDL